jgi:hypothetical protein
MVHAHCMMDIWGYRHTLRICNTYCFAATMVTRTCLNFTLIRTLLIFFGSLFITPNLHNLRHYWLESSRSDCSRLHLAASADLTFFCYSTRKLVENFVVVPAWEWFPSYEVGCVARILDKNASIFRIESWKAYNLHCLCFFLIRMQVDIGDLDTVSKRCHRQEMTIVAKVSE